MNAPAVEVRDLTYRYPGNASATLDAMSFVVEQGEVFGFLGPSGAGKTTAQRAVVGLLEGWSGSIDVLGRDHRSWGRRLHDRIGVAFELPVGYPRLSVREDLTHFGRLHGGPVRQPAPVLEQVGLTAAADVPVRSLSKGMRVRLNIARALLHEPDLLFLDEPTSGLDPVNAAAIRSLIRAQQAAGRTIFLTTHDMATAAAVCDRVAFVMEGRIVACERPRTLRLAASVDRRIRVEYRSTDGPATATFALGDATDAAALATLVGSGDVETVHTTEASLDDVFRAVTGHAL